MIGLRCLSRADALLAGAGDWARALDDVSATVRLMREGKAGMVAESVLPMGADPRSNAYGLPAFVGGTFDAVGLKWAVHRGEPAGDLPAITSTTLVNRLDGGRPVGVVESALLTRMRTAAVSAIAIQHLATWPVRRVAVLGAGEQARTHIEMLQALFPDVESVTVWNRNTGRSDALATRLQQGDRIGLRSAPTICDALDGSQVVLCCTASPEPLIGREAVVPGRLIVQVGYNEIGFDLVDAVDHVVVDLWGEFAERSAKSLFQMYRAGRFAPDRVSADLASLVVDGWRPPDGTSVLFSSFGLNVFDIALAARVLGEAERIGAGTVLKMF